MKLAVIYGTSKKQRSTTYNLAQKAIEVLKEKDEVKEIWLPKDMNHFCQGCFQCFNGKREKCGAYAQIEPIRKIIDEAEVIIFAVPVYVYHVPGQVKALLDHFGWQWMVHQINGKMFSKQAFIITTCAGTGTKSTVKDIKDNMDFWGVGKVYEFAESVRAADWEGVKPDNKVKYEKEIVKISNKIMSNKGKVKPRLKVKLNFYQFRMLQKKINLSEVDRAHWDRQGYLGNKRPW